MTAYISADCVGKQPKSTFIQSANGVKIANEKIMQRTRNLFLIIFCGSLLLAAGLLITELLRQSGRAVLVAEESTQVAKSVAMQQMTLTALANNTPVPTQTPFPTGTARPNYLATVQVEATATRTAINEHIATGQGWPLTLSEPFSNNRLEWPTGDGNDELSQGGREVVGGEYVWDLDALQSFYWVEVQTRTVSAETFYYSVELTQDDSSNGTQSIVFQFGDNSNFYFFGLCGANYYAGWRLEGSWTRIVNCEPTSVINVGGTNKLSVLSQDERFLLFINDTFMTEMWANPSRSGKFGVLVEMEAGDENAFRYDNVILRVPSTTRK